MNFEQFINNRKSINVGFIGGSITAGSGSSNIKYSYIEQVCTKLANLYNDVQFNCINAGVGGTTSTLGLFRLQQDLLDHKPDIAFIEFAVNDSSLETTGVYMENIVRQIKKYKDIPVLIILTITSTILDTSGSVRASQAGQQHIRLADYYNLELINVGDDLYEKSQRENSEFSGFFIDGVHPNDSGHEVYADIIVDHLKQVDFKENDLTKPFLFGREFENPGLLMGNTLKNDTWKLSYNNMYNRLPDYIYSFTPGDELTFEFKGSFLGLYFTIEKDSGIIEFKVDDGEWQEQSLWDKYALQFNRAAFTILCEELENKVHTVTIRNTDKKDEKSEGYYVRIGAFTIG